MPLSNFFGSHWPKLFVALGLTLASGIVDIAGYLGIYRLFTAHMTGTTVHLGLNLVNGNWRGVVSAIFVIVFFVLGSLLGRALIELGCRKDWKRIAASTLGLEAVLLIWVAISRGVSAHPSPLFDLSLIAMAMGLQTATLMGIGPLTVHTTFITGMLNKLTQQLAHIGFETFDIARKSPDELQLRQARLQAARKSAFLSSVWLMYVAGAAIGTWGFSRYGTRCILLAVGLLLITIATDIFSPLSIAEEQEQSER